MTDYLHDPSDESSLRSLAGFRLAIDSIVDAKDGAPGLVTHKAFDRLDDEAKVAYDDTRLDWFANGFYLNNPVQRRIFSTSRALLRTHNPNTVGAHGIVLDGPPHIGKTSVLIRQAREVERMEGKRNPEFRDEGLVPVAYIEMEPNSTPKSIADSVLEFFGIPRNFKSASQHELTAQAIDALRRHRTRLLAFDELQMLKLRGKMGDDAINSLKTFMNNSGAVCIFAGVDLRVGLASRAAEQIMARCQVSEMLPMTGTDEVSRERWASVVNALGSAMNLLDAEPGHLAPYADLLRHLSNGKIGDLRGTLHLAMAQALDERDEVGVEVVTQDMLLGIGQVGVA